MDILTPRGQETAADERAAALLWEGQFEDCRYVPTPKHKPASVDALLLSRGVLRGVAETKCRYSMTTNQFFHTFKGEWLVTMDKLVKAANVAAGLGVPLYGFLYLVDERVLITKRLTDDAGLFDCAFRCERTETQATCNGGTACRANAFLDMNGANMYRPLVDNSSVR